MADLHDRIGNARMCGFGWVLADFDGAVGCNGNREDIVDAEQLLRGFFADANDAGSLWRTGSRVPPATSQTVTTQHYCELSSTVRELRLCWSARDPYLPDRDVNRRHTL
jgi:hypothetical protein